jgi:hypothetical protein
MKKKLINWLTTRVDTLLATEVWHKLKATEKTLAVVCDNIEKYHAQHRADVKEIAALKADRAALNTELYG